MLPLLLALAACKSAGTPSTGSGVSDITYHSALAEEDGEPPPSYGHAELQKALIAERAAEASGEQKIETLEADGDPDSLNAARADLAVRRRFIAALEVCEQTGRYCPPRLDDPAWSFDVETEADPKLDTTLRFDLDSWQKVSAELHGRACACRTLACVDSMNVAIDKLEKRPMPEVQADETSSIEIMRARDCLFRLRGKRALPHLEQTAAE
ncbi:MAG TPA: hypothetical protein VLB44_15270 [Kofleriaceae bacterium]|nr:hypothetical protein [Kofleriaceae bacterium]